MPSNLPGLIRRVRTPLATRQDRNVRWLYVYALIEGIEEGGIYAFLPIFMVRLGASAMTISLLTALRALATILVALPAGALALRWRKRVRASVLVWSAMRSAYLGVTLAVLLSPAWATKAILAIWTLAAVANTAGNLIWYDILAELVEPERRPRLNGTTWALNGLTTAMSVAFFGQFLQRVAFPTNYMLVFFFSFLSGAAEMCFMARLEVPDRREPPAPLPTLSLGAWFAEVALPLRRGGPFLRCLLITFFLRLGLYLPAGLYSVYWVRSLNATEGSIGWRTTISSAAMTLGFYVWGRMAGRHGYLRMLPIAMVGMSAYPLITSLTTPDTLPLLLVAALFAGWFGAGIEVSIFEVLIRSMPEDQRPRYTAVNSTVFNLVAFVGPIAGAAVAARIGIYPVLWGSGVCLLCAAVATLFWGRSRPSAPAERCTRAAG